MLYAYIDKNQLKLIYLKKSLLGQYEATFFEKKHEVDLLNKGRVRNIDVLASAMKEGLDNVLPKDYEKNVYLIIPQEAFKFFKADIPKDINPSSINSFVQDKAKSVLPEAENYYFDYFIKEIDDQKQVNFFGVDQETLDEYNQSLNLVGLRLASVLPESLAVFKLFEKTLRKEKKENILYLNYSDDVWGYQYDTGGLVSEEKWIRPLRKDEPLDDAVKEITKELEEKGTKLNRIILSGEKSEKIRQDTFTKAVGVWTNPLKRIIPNFYQDYLKTLIVASDKSFPLLVYDVCFGAFVFASENKDFQILKKPLKRKGAKKFGGGERFFLFRKEVLIFLASALVSFLIFFAVSGVNLAGFSFSKLLPQKPTPAPTKVAAKPTVAPQVKREELKIKVLNGSGIAGKAGEVQEILQDAGYQEIVTDNADNFDYETTIIQVKKSVKSAGEMLKKDLADYVKSPKVETLNEEETSDVIIIVGTDLK